MTASSVKQPRAGATLVEVLVAAALGVIVIGGGILMYDQGNRSFTTTTEHASFRSEALLCLETINRDLNALVVSDEVNAATGFHYMVQPYVLSDPVAQKGKDRSGQDVSVEIPTGIAFHRYHRTEMRPADDGKTKATVVGQKVEYRARLIDPAAPARGMNLLRNGRRVNKLPLSGVLFEPVDPIYAANTIGASPAAVLKVTIVPRGGLFGGMTPEVIQTLRQDGKVATRVFHLSGYESQFTMMLWLAMAKQQGGVALDPLEQAVVTFSDKLPAAFRGNVRDKLKEAFDLGYRLDQGRVVLEDRPYDEATAGVDREFAEAKDGPAFEASTVTAAAAGRSKGGSGFTGGAGSGSAALGSTR